MQRPRSAARQPAAQAADGRGAKLTGHPVLSRHDCGRRVAQTPNARAASRPAAPQPRTVVARAAYAGKTWRAVPSVSFAQGRRGISVVARGRLADAKADRDAGGFSAHARRFDSGGFAVRRTAAARPGRRARITARLATVTPGIALNTLQSVWKTIVRRIPGGKNKHSDASFHQFLRLQNTSTDSLVGPDDGCARRRWCQWPCSGE